MRSHAGRESWVKKQTVKTKSKTRFSLNASLLVHGLLKAGSKDTSLCELALLVSLQDRDFSQETNVVNTGDTFRPHSIDNSDACNSAPDMMAASASTGEPGGRKNSPIREYGAARTASNLVSIVQRRFVRMNEAHDRIRAELLARYPSREG